MKMKKHLIASFAVLTLSGVACLVRADVVLDWNGISAQAIFSGGRPGASINLDFAVVHAAMHDAVQAYDKRFEPYAVAIPDASGSMAAAVATAAHDVLVIRFPAQAATLDATYIDYLAANGIDPNDPGVIVGQQAAAAIIALRSGDGSFPSVPPPDFVGANLPGVWRPTPSYLPGPPPSFAPMAFPWLAEVTPFMVRSADQFRAEPPPVLNSGRYAKDYNEVKALGSLNSTERTVEQTQIARFWSDNPIAQWNRALRTIAETHLDNSGDIARLFALAWLAAADGLITTWDSKLHYVYWRPVTAIQEGNAGRNAKTAGDPNWQPLVNTPNYPEYSAGAPALSGSMTEILRRYFGTDKFAFSLTSTHPLANPNVRTYSRLSDAAEEHANARIYQGIHFRSGSEAGRKVGENVAKWIFHHALRPLQGHQEEEQVD